VIVNEFLVKEGIAMVDEKITDKAHQQAPGTSCPAFENQPVQGGRHIRPQQQGKNAPVVCRSVIIGYFARSDIRHRLDSTGPCLFQHRNRPF
jgi:hypothetical protein